MTAWTCSVVLAGWLGLCARSGGEEPSLIFGGAIPQLVCANQSALVAIYLTESAAVCVDFNRQTLRTVLRLR